MRRQRASVLNSSTGRLQWRRSKRGLGGCLAALYLIHKNLGLHLASQIFPSLWIALFSGLATPRARYFTAICRAGFCFLPLVKRRWRAGYGSQPVGWWKGDCRVHFGPVNHMGLPSSKFHSC